MKLVELKKNAINYGLELRLVNLNDAERILKLRTNPLLSRHIHHTDADLEKQIKYIEYYKLREIKGTEYYFAFSQKGDNKPIGFYRIHSIDFQNKTFTIGSWIFEQKAQETLPILADILIKEFGFELLNLETCFFDVRRENKKVHKYHMLFSPFFLREDEEGNIFYCLKKENFEANKNSILKYII